jgi:formylglycine-generating enzyme required for sulfatase activity
MIGNVWEWTSSKPSYYPGNDLTVKPVQQNWEIIRGGSLASDPQGDKPITAAYRDWIDPTTKNELLGFRLVREGS